jgi:hypothetical protein
VLVAVVVLVAPRGLVVHRMLVVHRVLVRRSSLVSKVRLRNDLTPHTQNSEEEELDPVERSARLRPLRFGLMTVGHTNLVSLIGVSHPATHAAETTTDNGLASRKQASRDPGNRPADMGGDTSVAALILSAYTRDSECGAHISPEYRLVPAPWSCPSPTLKHVPPGHGVGHPRPWDLRETRWESFE